MWFMVAYEWFKNKIFFIIYISLCKTCGPCGGATYVPRGIIRTILVGDHKMML